MSAAPSIASPSATPSGAWGPTGSIDDAGVVAQSRLAPERFGTIFDRYFAEIHRYACRRLGTDGTDGTDGADDVAAETFLAAFRQRDRFDPRRGTVRAWLYGIATNLLRNRGREETRVHRGLKPVDGGIIDSHEERVTARVSAGSVQRRLSHAMAELQPGDREVLLLVALAGLSYDEVAQAMEIPYGTVCSRLSRARRLLREALGGTDPTRDDEGVNHG